VKSLRDSSFLNCKISITKLGVLKEAQQNKEAQAAVEDLKSRLQPEGIRVF
jgi:hypothetical protein